MPRPKVQELRWRDPPLAKIETPKGKLRLTLSVGSGLTRRPGDPPGRVWGLGDRGPNLKIEMAVGDYGLPLERLAGVEGAKVLPVADFQPLIAELDVGKDRVELVRTLALRSADGPLSGRAPEGDPGAPVEPTYDLEGHLLPADPAGVDPEGIAALADGSFWISEEYGPSLLRIDAGGMVRQRWTPLGREMPGADAVLPARAKDRQMNRGFEGLAISGDERWLYVVFQSAFEGEDERTTAIWKLDARDGSLAGEYVYPFDKPKTFKADVKQEEADRGGLKLCELVWLGPDRLLVLERIRWSGRLYEVDVSKPGPLTKTLLFSTDWEDGFAPDLEGVTLLSDRELLLVTDNDFGTEGQETRFYRLTFEAPL